jgi:hypothetical protein
VDEFSSGVAVVGMVLSMVSSLVSRNRIPLPIMPLKCFYRPPHRGYLPNDFFMRRYVLKFFSNRGKYEFCERVYSTHDGLNTEASLMNFENRYISYILLL